ncbi:MAG: ribosome biogenesis GTPase Der, partial [Chloroflexi bacterium]|nr:ribosome biogenesis GTPase Der [Chloroflexota bacterium]
MPKPIVAIVGSPNVGKSTFFNRVVDERLAIVADLPGTTRDRLYSDGEWNGRDFTLVDTGGLVIGPSGVIEERVQEQAQQAIDEADVIVFMVDARSGLSATDLEVADTLRPSNKPVILAANKADNAQRDLDAVDFYQLGLGEPIPISSLHGRGTGDLLDAIVSALPPVDEDEAELQLPKIAIVGRPNVGKSSILNAILGEERVIVSEIPGTTRDAIDTIIQHHGQELVLIDTAGIRRRGRVEAGVERFSVLRSLRAIGRADVAVLVLDAEEVATAQDTHIASHIVEAGKSVVLAVNKWDLISKTGKTTQEFTAIVREAFKFMPYAPILFISAKTRQRLDALLDLALEVREERYLRVSTGPLNDLIRSAILEHPPHTYKGRRLKLLY